MIYLRRIVGESMAPTLKANQIVIAIRTKKYKPGQIVIAKQSNREVIKRLRLAGNGDYLLFGDNSLKSSDSRQYGPIKAKNIMGRVLFVL
jgi:phage repressor protein C with HTH and peptisase S24 domain